MIALFCIGKRIRAMRADVYPHYGQGRRFRIRAEIHEGPDNKSYLLAAADVDYATGECKIIENKYPDAVNMHF